MVIILCISVPLVYAIDSFTASYPDTLTPIGDILGVNSDFASVKGGSVSKAKGITTITLDKVDGVFVLDNQKFTNIKPASASVPAYIKVDNTGKIIEADFTTNDLGGVYELGGQKINLPSNSHIVYKNGKLQVLLVDNTNLKIPPKTISPNSVPVELQGTNIRLPNGAILNSGKLLYNNGIPFVEEGSSATINGISVFSETQDVQLSQSEGSSVVIRENSLKLKGNGYSVAFSPGAFLNSEQIPENQYLAGINLDASSNGRYFTINDHGPSVNLIQKLVGVKETGVYDQETFDAVKTWQAKNSLKPDGKFGKLSRYAAFPLVYINPTSPQTSMVFERGSEDALSIDLTGPAELSLGSRSLIVPALVSKPPNLPLLKEGNKGADVKALQEYLIKDGYLSGSADGVFGVKTKRAVMNLQKSVHEQTGVCAGIIQGQSCAYNGVFNVDQFSGIAISKSYGPTLYKKVMPPLHQGLKTPIELTLRDERGVELVKELPYEGPSPLETLESFVREGVRNEGYFTGQYKTSIHVNTVLFDNVPGPESLASDAGIASNTMVSQESLDRMFSFVESGPVKSLQDPDERFNQIVRQAGAVANYDPEETLKLIGIFGSRYKDLSPDVTSGYGNKHLVNGRSSERYKRNIPLMGSGSGRDPTADKKYRLITVGGQYLYAEGPLKGTRIALEHTAYEVLAYGGKLMRKFKGSESAYGSGDFGDVSADFAATRFASALENDPKGTLENFDVHNYISP